MSIPPHFEPFIEAQSLLTKGASPLKHAVLSLETHFPQLADPDASLTGWDGAISNLYHILAAVSFYRGTLAPIYHLPDDILTRIFRLHLRVASSALEGDLGWSQIMLVCRRWHALIMNDGFLWSFIDLTDCTYGLLLPRQLERSGGWPLTIHHHPISPTIDVYTYTIIAKLCVPPRITALLIEYASKHLIREALRILGASGLAELTSLKVDCDGSNDGEGLLFLPQEISSLPRLERLELSEVGVTLPKSLLLTELDLSIRPHNAYYDMHTFLKALSDLPNLEILKISHAVRNPDETVLQVVHLPRLRVLSLRGYKDALQGLLTSLCIPHKVRVLVYSNTIISDAAVASRVLVAPLRRFFRHSDGWRIKTVAVSDRLGLRPEDGGLCDMEIAGFDHKDRKIIRHARTLDDRKAMNFVFIVQRGKAQIRMSRKIFTSLMHHAEVLDVRFLTYAPLSPSWWKMALLSLPALSEVYLSADSGLCFAFCQALQKLMDTHPKTFPRLRGVYIQKASERIVAEEASFFPAHWQQQPRDVELPRRNFVALRDVLRMYKERGHRVEWVAISNDDPAYWPGVEGSRELVDLVQKFMYDEDKAYGIGYCKL